MEKSDFDINENDSTKQTCCNRFTQQIKQLRNKLGLDLFIVFVVVCCLTLTGMLGMIIHGVFTKERGPVWLRNHYIGLWLCSLIVYYSLQAFYSLFKDIKKNNKAFHYIEIAYFVVCNAALFVMEICYIMGAKIDAVIWSIAIDAANCISIAVLIVRRKRAFNGVNNDEISVIDKTIDTNASKHSQRCITALVVANIILRGLFLLFLGFLTTGSVVMGGMTATYPARGKFVNVPLADNSGRTLKMHYLCDGPINNSFPVYMFEGSGSHGMADYLGLQKYLKEKNKRSCIWDKPGLGYSDYMYSDMTDFTLIYHNFMKSIGEKSPFIFVGWGGGGPTVYKYALSHPEMVYSITFLDVSPNKVEFTIPKILKNWTDSEYNTYYKSELASRYSLFGIINGLGVPWGLMSLFVPVGTSDPPEYRSEINWHMLTEKTWITQYYLLESIYNDVDNYTTPLSTGITLNHMTTVWSDAIVVNKTCIPRKLDQNSADCQYEIQANKKLIELRLNMVPYNTVINCTSSDCNLGYYVFDNPSYTVDNLMNLYKNAKI